MGEGIGKVWNIGQERIDQDKKGVKNEERAGVSTFSERVLGLNQCECGVRR